MTCPGGLALPYAVAARFPIGKVMTDGLSGLRDIERRGLEVLHELRSGAEGGRAGARGTSCVRASVDHS